MRGSLRFLAASAICLVASNVLAQSASSLQAPQAPRVILAIGAHAGDMELTAAMDRR